MSVKIRWIVASLLVGGLGSAPVASAFDLGGWNPMRWMSPGNWFGNQGGRCFGNYCADPWSRGPGYGGPGYSYGYPGPGYGYPPGYAYPPGYNYGATGYGASGNPAPPQPGTPSSSAGMPRVIWPDEEPARRQIGEPRHDRSVETPGPAPRRERDWADYPPRSYPPVQGFVSDTPAPPAGAPASGDSTAWPSRTAPDYATQPRYPAPPAGASGSSAPPARWGQDSAAQSWPPPAGDRGGRAYGASPSAAPSGGYPASAYPGTNVDRARPPEGPGAGAAPAYQASPGYAPPAYRGTPAPGGQPAGPATESYYRPALPPIQEEGGALESTPKAGGERGYPSGAYRSTSPYYGQ